MTIRCSYIGWFPFIYASYIAAIRKALVELLMGVSEMGHYPVVKKSKETHPSIAPTKSAQIQVLASS